MPPEGYADFLETLGVAGLGGGAVYDGLVRYPETVDQAHAWLGL